MEYSKINKIQINNYNFELTEIISEELIKDKVKDISSKISRKFMGKNPVIIGVLNGSFVFLSDLIRNIEINCELDFIKVSSYINSSNRGKIELELKNKIKLDNREIIIVEDIIDSGNTLSFLYDHFKKLNVKSISSAVLLNKYQINKKKIILDWIGFNIEDNFVVGYGLDYNNYFRNLKSIYKIVNER